MSLGLIASLLLAYNGMLGLCLGLERHYKQCWQPVPHRAVLRVLRGIGWLALAASFACSVKLWGWAIGPVGWFGLVSLAGITLVLLLPYAARASVALAGAGWPLLGIAALL